MDKIELSLNQVNFEEQTLADNSGEDLHSFSNLVSYDTDFEQIAGGAPVTSRKLAASKEPKSPVLDGLSAGFQFSREEEEELRLYSLSKRNLAHNSDIRSDSSGSRRESGVMDAIHPSLPDNSRHGDSGHQFSSKPADTFTAFTETVEALALQKSVIGNSSITPASADEVARVIAETQARMQQSMLKTGKSSSANTQTEATTANQMTGVGGGAKQVAVQGGGAKQMVVQGGGARQVSTDSVFNDSLSSNSDTMSRESVIHSTDNSFLETTRQDQSILHSTPNNGSRSGNLSLTKDSGFETSEQIQSSPGHKKTRTTSNSSVESISSTKSKQSVSNTSTRSGDTLEDDVLSDGNMGPLSIAGKELIRVRADGISRDAKKSSGWFWGKSSVESPDLNASKQKSKAKANGAAGKLNKKDSKSELVSGEEQIKGNETPVRSSVDSDISRKSSSSDSTKQIQQQGSGASPAKEDVDGRSNEVTLKSNPSVVVESVSASTSSIEVKPGEVTSVSSSVKAGSSTAIATTVTEGRNSVSKTSTSSGIDGTSPTGDRVVINATESRSFHGTNTNVKIEKNLEQVKRVVVSREEVVTRSAPQTPVKKGGEGQSSDVGQLLKEKAKLEGHIEVLEGENKEMLRERAELLSKVAGLTQELSSNKSNSQNLAGDRDALSADLETLRQNRARLEAVIIDAHKLLEEKDQDLQSLTRDVESARAVGDKYLEKLSESKQELKSREATADDLKTKITELYVEFQTTNQNRILAVNEVESLQGEMKALAAAKDWYKDQLQAFQREKMELQSEVTRVKTEMIGQGTTIEHLKAENSRVKRYVGEMEQKSLSEKQGLARHLEMIEADMMEREAAFSQLKRERQLVESVQSSSEEDDKRALEEDLEAAQNDARRAHSQLAVLQSEHTDLSKRLALSQECILERDRMIESLEKSREDVESRLAKSELEISGRDELMERVHHDKSALEVELAAVTEEKRVFDTSLKSLKEDMSKVEASFRSMKNELLAKQSVIAELQEELQKVRTGAISGSVDGADRHMNGQRLIEIANVHSFAPPRHIMQALTKYEVGETQTDEALVESAQLQEKISEMEALQRHTDSLREELSGVRNQLTSALSERKDLEDGKVTADRELILTKERLLEVEVKLQQAVEERTNLERVLMERSALDVKESLEMLQAAAPAGPTVDPQTLERLSALQTENSELMTRLEDVRRDADKDLNEQKYEVVRLMEQLESLDKSQREAIGSIETQNNELTLEVATLQESKKRLETDLEDVRSRASMDLDAVTTQLQSNLEKARNEIETLHESRREIELRLETIVTQNRIEIEEFIHKTTVLETELHTARTYIDEKQAVYDETQSLAIELEREKGRLAGILQSHSALKEHASSLEHSLASKESSVVQLSSHVNDEIERKERETSELREHVKVLEESLVKERQTAKDARKHLLTEKGSHVKARRELEQLTAEHQQLVGEVEQLRRDMLKVTEELETGQTSEVSRKLESERIVSELKTVTLDRDRLMRDSIEMEAKEATMKEQIQSLEWKHSEKEAEVKAANDRIKLIEERQRFDINNLSQTLQSTTTELVALRREMSSVTQERSELKTQIVRLKDALRMIIEQQQKKGGKMEIVIDYEELNRLLADSEPPPVESRPLSFLQATLTGLRGEISSLQLQVNEHTSAVQSSSQAWKELEAQVLDLREVCQSSAAGRAASQTGSETLIQPDLDLQSILQLTPPSLTDLTNQTSQDITSITSTTSSVTQAPNGAEISMSTVSTSQTSKKKSLSIVKTS